MADNITVRPSSIWALEEQGSHPFFIRNHPIAGSVGTRIVLPRGILHCDWCQFPHGDMGCPSMPVTKESAGINQLERG